MMAEIANPDLQKKPVGELMDDVMEQSEDVLRRGAAVTAELNELRQRADKAMDWRRHLHRRPWLSGIAVAAFGFLVVAISRD
jgi:hypothetical protein